MRMKIPRGVKGYRRAFATRNRVLWTNNRKSKSIDFKVGKGLYSVTVTSSKKGYPKSTSRTFKKYESAQNYIKKEMKN